MQIVFDVSTRLLAALSRFTNYGEQIMATLQEVQGELVSIKAGVDTSNALAAQQVAMIADLKAQLAAGSPVTQADLDDLDAKADAILAAQGAAPAGTPPDQV